MNDQEELSKCQQQILELSKDVEMFAQATSHTLRDPLRQALVYCEEIKNNENAQSITNIEDEINAVLDKITLLRQYSQLINFNKELSQIDCNEVLQQVLNDLSDKISSSKAIIQYDTLPQITAYEEHIYQLFYQLIDNSIKFCADTSPEIFISYTEDKGVFTFSIKDNAEVLEEMYSKLIFSLFQKMDPESNPSSYGVGLAFCKKIVQNFNGQIGFKPDQQGGNIFSFSIKK